jgi:hypothetical protein
LRTRRYENILYDLTVALLEEGIFSNPIGHNEDLIEEQELEEEIHESHQVHEIEELPHELVEEEDFNEAHHVEDQVHEEIPIESTPHEDESLTFVLHLMKMKSPKLPPLLHMKTRIW